MKSGIRKISFAKPVFEQLGLGNLSNNAASPSCYSPTRTATITTRLFTC